jgi:hypothetical protein|tara:strand:- start:2537 stop:3253 length:717 start_codon:yes stop_codon:yes gene_type:complete
MKKDPQHIKFDSAAYFGTPVWTAQCPVFIKPMLKLTDRYLKSSRKKVLEPAIKQRDKTMNAALEDFTLSNHSESFNRDPQAKEFVDFCGQRSYEFLDWCGFNLKNYSLHFSECWVQEFSHKGGGHHDTHVHWSQHVSGFFFLKCSNKTSLPVLHDPRPGAMMTKLPEKDMSKISFANPAVHYNVQPGTMVIVPGYTPHQYPVDLGLEPFRFVHWNIQAVPSVISDATSMKKENDPPKK